MEEFKALLLPEVDVLDLCFDIESRASCSFGTENPQSKVKHNVQTGRAQSKHQCRAEQQNFQKCQSRQSRKTKLIKF